jgi:integrator complex subunit 9
LGSNESTKCFIIKFKTTNIMIDCSLNSNSFLSQTNLKMDSKITKKRKRNDNEHDISIVNLSGMEYLHVEEIKIETPSFECFDLSTIDLILISNFNNILSLPYITERSNFKGKIIATEPTVKIGEKMMIELSKSLKLNENLKTFEFENLESFHYDYFFKWNSIYSQEEIKNSISKIQTISFSEYVDIFGSFKISCCSSGYCIGSSNWIIETEYEKVVFCSSSSPTSRHPQVKTI